MTQSVTRGSVPNRPRSAALAPLHQHSAMHRGVMFDWLRHCDEAGEPYPSDEAIAARFDMAVESARTLLADLADRGEIRVTRKGQEREIVVAPVKARRVHSTPAIIRSVTRPRGKPAEIDEDAALERIKGILNRSTPEQVKLPPRVEAVPEPAPAVPLRPPQPEREVAPMPPETTAVPVQRKVPAAVIVATTTSLYISAALRRRIIAITGGDIDCPTLRALVEEALSAREAPVALTGKPMVPAAVLRAANTADADLHDFCSTLLRIGLAAWEKGER